MEAALEAIATYPLGRRVGVKEQLLDLAGMAAYTAGLRRVLAILAGNDRLTAQPDSRRPIAGRYQQVEQGGLFVASVNLGDHVTPATVLGRLVNLLGEAPTA